MAFVHRNASVFIVREKGRNAADALEEELGETAAPLLELVNGIGKQAAKTGDNWETVAAWTDTVDAVTMKETGRQYPRPVFTAMETEDALLCGREAPAATVDAVDADWFYAGYDELLEYGLTTGKIGPALLRDGFEPAVDRYLDRTGYDREQSLGDSVTWGVLNADGIPDDADTVLIPDNFAALGTALAGQRYGDADMATFQEYTDRQDITATDEEAVIAAADVPGIYMYITGATADQYGLCYEPVFDGAASRLGRYTPR